MAGFSLVHQWGIWEGSLVDPFVNSGFAWLIRTILPGLYHLLAASKFMAHLLDINKLAGSPGL